MVGARPDRLPMSPEPGPVTYRPHRLRITAIITSVVLAGLYLVGWFALPGAIRALVTLSQRLTLLAILAVLVGALWAIAASSVRADASGLRIRNGLRTHRLAWPEIRGFSLRAGDPWAFVGLDPDGDVERRAMLGIQAGDGERAQSAVADLRVRLAAART